ncbi:MAG TPA: cytochrome c maturation protein CcmE [Devosiaceae bacterium]|nr:cytochrome c maturation protein CcmE [Devosiaceae bacterium]
MTRKQRRLAVIGGLGAAVLIAVVLIAVAFQSTFSFFLTPAELVAHPVQDGRAFRIGGLVKTGSCVREGDTLRFVITDGEAELAASFAGLVPDLFREGQGVVADGALAPGGGFVATAVMAKHDETYIPAEIADELRARGEWYEGNQPEALPAADNPCRAN